MTDAGDTGGDGRTARRERNRDAVVTALLELYREGEMMPSADDIAARAGVSARSLFRYFADVDDLAFAAVTRQAEHLMPLLALDVDPDATTDERIDAFVAARLRLLEAMGEVGRVARFRASTQPVVAEGLARVREVMREHVVTVLGPALADRPADERRAVIAAADVLCSWEAHDLMRNDQGLSGPEAGAAMGLGLRRLLADAPHPAR
ncbi:MAG TPA: TetR/AcrR family transcriptional regulator [Iamia sp.]|nr:TetR/AcrR family transcriptional regulator [Iamia sp.]